MARTTVAVLFTTPEAVVEDYGRLMDLAGLRQHLPAAFDTILKINISWHHYFPGCSTTPWQFDGVIRKLRQEGYENLIPAQKPHRCRRSQSGRGAQPPSPRQWRSTAWSSPTSMSRAWRGVNYQPRARMRVLHDVFPEDPDRSCSSGETPSTCRRPRRTSSPASPAR